MRPILTSRYLDLAATSPSPLCRLGNYLRLLRDYRFRRELQIPLQEISHLPMQSHARSLHLIEAKSNSPPSSVPKTTTQASRSSGGRLNATSKGTPFRTK